MYSNTFNAGGHEWSLQLSMGSVHSIKSRCFIDLGAPDHVETVCALQADPYTFGKILWTLVKRQAETLGVTEDAFFDSIDGDVFAAAHRALAEAFALWAPLASREFIRQTFENYQDAMQRVGAEILADMRSPAYSAAIAGTIEGGVKQLLASAAG
ncbi:hypothetical protein [Lacipirellula parvula]|uniref:Uncharacterized protein n=1 Tax=Lacipirellula parvula TaxID=2650471 RepID=A0A5K7XE31_9BACT|nr:hypothetical protein [Lacipirellula parvula]BBO32503.1 hypothetical protein PLANPX_2115 [Lacipirellula parvula]